ncbi:MAG: hypothetical protein QME14_00260 [Methanobacteriaceae archaeon]|nr:hypothetical protein [Methanobacteriaceae archaeon]
MVKRAMIIISLFIISLGFFNYSYADTAPDLSLFEDLGNIDNLKNLTDQALSNATNITENTAQDIEKAIGPIEGILDSINSIIQQLEQIWWSLTGQE